MGNDEYLRAKLEDAYRVVSLAKQLVADARFVVKGQHGRIEADDISNNLECAMTHITGMMEDIL